jgi:exopolysaccharide production protein ExoZ
VTVAEPPILATAGTAARPTIHSIQVMRGVASIAVALYHTGIILAQPVYGRVVAFPALSGIGWTGVNFFFVLSGFIIAYAHAGDVGRPERAGRYLWRRFSRIYPFYWLCLAAFLAAAIAGLGHPDIRWTAGDLASSALLVRLIPEPVLPLHVAWTLLYEIGFYALFLLPILHRRLGIAALVLWGAAVLVGGVGLGLGWQPLHAWNANFLLGICAWWAFGRLPGRWGAPLLAAGLLMFAALVAAGLVDARIGPAQDRPERLLLLGVAFTLVLLGGVVWDRHAAWKAPAALLLLGEASYAIYLIHSAALSVFAVLNHKLWPGVLPAPVAYVLAAAFGVGAGVVVHRVIERPLLRAMRDGWPHRARPAPLARAAARD